MSIDRPRRLFGGNSRTASAGRAKTVWAGVIGVTAAAVLMALAGRVFDPAPTPPGVIAGAADQVAVIDGDTLQVSGTVVRLSDIAAPARGEACAAGPDCGGRASAALAGLVFDHRVECRVTGQDGAGRPAALCSADGLEINATMVSIGWVRAETEGLRPAEAAARAARRGLWLAG